ncbi:MAG: hypothetical protein U1E73_01210 [Planctomycetota bacterium]
MSSSLGRALLSALLVTTLAAQRPVLTVGGTNPTHASLQAAVAAAAPDSVIMVRAGTHTGFTTNKPLRIVLDFTAATGSVVAPAGAAYAIEVNGLLGDQELAISGRGARIAGGTLGAVRVANCSGRVVLDRVSVALGNVKTALDVQNAAAVVVQNSSLDGRHALQAQDAVVATQGVQWTSAVDIAIVAARAFLELTAGSCTGGSAPALRVADSVLVLAGTGTTAIGVTGGPSVPVSAIEAVQSDVVWDPLRFALAPANGAPALLRFGGQVTVQDMPALTAMSGPLGSPLTATLRRGTSSFGMIAIGALRLPYPLAGVPDVWIDPAWATLVLAAGTVDAQGITTQATWPNVPWLVGEMFCLQGVVLGNGSGPLVTGPAMWIGL